VSTATCSRANLYPPGGELVSDHHLCPNPQRFGWQDHIASSRQCAFFETKKAPKRQKRAAGKNLWARIGRSRRTRRKNFDTTSHRVPRPPTLRRRNDETVVPSRRVIRSIAVRPAKPPALYGLSLKLGWGSTGVHRTRDGDYRVEAASGVPWDSQRRRP
jgi:hypothetical protein